MKKITIKTVSTGVVLLMTSLFLTGCWLNAGKLIIVSTRNMDSKSDYVLLSKSVTGKAKTKKGEALQSAIDNAVKQYPTGEFMKNVNISIKTNGKKVRVVGDIWGEPPTDGRSAESVSRNVTKSVNAKVEFKTGDAVTFMGSKSKVIEGKIIGVNQNTAIVEQSDGTKSEIKYEKLTKIER